MRVKNPDSHTIEELIEAVKRTETSSDKAFRRFLVGEVQSSSAASRLAAEVENARMDVRLHPDFDINEHEEWA